MRHAPAVPRGPLPIDAVHAFAAVIDALTAARTSTTSSTTSSTRPPADLHVDSKDGTPYAARVDLDTSHHDQLQENPMFLTSVIKPFVRHSEAPQGADPQAHPSQRFPSGRSRPTRVVAEDVSRRMVMPG